MKTDTTAIDDRLAVAAQPIYASFVLDAEEYAVDVRYVREIVNLPSAITLMPLAPDFVAGVFNLRGTIIPVLNAKRLLQTGEQAGVPGSKVVIVDTGDLRVGLIVDDTGRVLRPNADEQTLFEYEDGSPRRLVAGVLKLGGGLVRVLDLQRLIALENVPHPKDGYGYANAARAKSQRRRCIVFRVGDVRLSFGIGGIHEIVLTPGIERSPVQEDLCAGVMHIRGQVVPVVRFAALLQMAAVTDASDAEARVIVLDIGQTHVGLLVDAVESIESYFEEDLMRVPVLTRHKADMFAGCIDFGERGHVFLLNSQGVLNNDEIKRVTGNFSKLFANAEQTARAVQGRTEQRQPFLWFTAMNAFALPMRQVREIIDFSAGLIVMPGAPAFVAGMANVRGKLVVVVDVRAFYELGNEAARNLQDRKIIVLDQGDALLGLLVDSVESIVRVNAADKIAVPGMLRNAMPARVRHDVVEVIQTVGEDERPMHLQVLNAMRIFAAVSEAQAEKSDV